MTNTTDLASSCDQVSAVDLGFTELSWMQMVILGII